MMKRSLYLAAPAFALAVPAAAHDTLPPGIWTNVEDVAFAQEEGREPQAETMLEIASDGRWRAIDAFGEPQGEWQDTEIPGLARRSSGSGWQVSGSELRQARDFSCWISVRKFASKPDGSSDWTFAGGLETFDQGGRVFVPGNGEAPDVTFRLRDVTWAAGSRNAPSLVLYVHKDDPDRAESYSWAAPDSERIGINLRWVQGSCSRESQTTETLSQSLDDAGERWRELYEAGNWEELATLYTDDAVLMAHGSDKVEGREAIVTFLRRLSDAGGGATMRFEPEEAVVQGVLGVVTAKYWMNMDLPGGAKRNIAGRSLLVYKRVDGEWLLWRDMDNSAPEIVADPMPE